MLEELRIKNFVLIEELSLTFEKGLNILTGETGAGKSILIDALSGILGEKMSTECIRTGCDRAQLEGIFDISSLNSVKAILEESGVDAEDETLIIRRELYSSGKGRCFVNSMQVPVTKLKEIGEYLIDIHGQNEHQSIMKVSEHRILLDRYAENGELLETVGALYSELASLKEKINSFQMDEREKARKIEFLKFAVTEIEEAKLSPNEEEELKEEENILSNSEKIFKQINKAEEMMNGDYGVLRNLKGAEQALSSVAEIDSEIASTLDTIREALYSLEDSSSFLRDYTSKFDFSPERINEVEERLALISSLKKKYGPTIPEIIKYLEKSKSELESINSSEEQIELLNEEYKKKIQETKRVALLLSEKRMKAALELEAKVMSELSDLNMKNSVFKVSIEQEISDIGEIESNNKRYALYPHGLDKIEFLLSANKGEELHQLRKVASGGEMSRIMLALKKVLLSNDIVETLIFDEVDTGISGKTAEIVGKKLKSLARERQVFVITHLPQIAAMSDSHFNVSKQATEDRTTSTVKHLGRKEKIEEVARMLAGEKITELSLQHAEEMVSLAENLTE